MAIEHDPLTGSQMALLQQLKANFIEVSAQEQIDTQLGRDLTFLGGCGLIKVEKTYQAQDVAKNRFRYSAF